MDVQFIVTTKSNLINNNNNIIYMTNSEFNEDLYHEMMQEPEAEITNECVQDAYLEHLWD